MADKTKQEKTGSIFAGLRVGFPSGDKRYDPLMEMLSKIGALVDYAIDRDSIPKDDIDLSRVVMDLDKRFDILFIPLTLKYYGSLRIAEIIHASNFSVRLILVSQSRSMSLAKATPLFDYYINTEEAILNVAKPDNKFREIIFRPSRPSIDTAKIESMISNIVSKEPCFIIDFYSGRHPELSIHATLAHYKARIYLEDARSQIKEQTDIDRVKYEWDKQSILAIRGGEAGLMYAVVGLVAFVSIVSIAAGIALVFIGGGQTQSLIEIFGQKITTGNAGVASIFLGVILILLVAKRLLTLIERVKLKASSPM